MKLLLLLIVTTTLGGCVRPGDHPISLNCTWDEEDSRSLDLTKTSDQRHLRFDAVTAEDVAIRWGDKYFSHRPEYDQRVGQCRETLFDGVAKHHSVDVAIVRQYSVNRDLLVDTVVIVSFGILYVLVAYVFTRRISNQFPPGEPGFWLMTITMAVGVSLVAVLMGNLWSIVIEGFRLNSGHLSYRMNRIPFRSHWAVFFTSGFVVFVFAALIRSRGRLRVNIETSSD